MRERETPPDTATRRGALRLSLAALTAGVAVPARAFAATAAMPGADAELIALCAIVVEQEAARRVLLGVRHTIADEQRTEPALQALYAEGERALDRLMALPGPSTVAGLQAMARASIAIAPQDLEGEIIPQGDAEWLAFGVAKVVANRPEPTPIAGLGWISARSRIAGRPGEGIRTLR